MDQDKMSNLYREPSIDASYFDRHLSDQGLCKQKYMSLQNGKKIFSIGAKN
jgi:hypothetical protein